MTQIILQASCCVWNTTIITGMELKLINFMWFDPGTGWSDSLYDHNEGLLPKILWYTQNTQQCIYWLCRHDVPVLKIGSPSSDYGSKLLVHAEKRADTQSLSLFSAMERKWGKRYPPNWWEQDETELYTNKFERRQAQWWSQTAYLVKSMPRFESVLRSCQTPSKWSNMANMPKWIIVTARRSYL